MNVKIQGCNSHESNEKRIKLNSNNCNTEENDGGEGLSWTELCESEGRNGAQRVQSTSSVRF